MRILLINTLYQPNFIGGAEKSVQMLAEELVKRGHQVNVVCLDTKAKEDVVNGVRVFYLKNKNFYWFLNRDKKGLLMKSLWHFWDTYFFLYKREFNRIIKLCNPEIIHTNNLSGFSSNLLLFLKKKWKTPIIHTARDYYFLCYKNTRFRGGSNCLRTCFLCDITRRQKMKCLNQSHPFFVGISTHILEKHRENGLLDTLPTSIVYNGVIEEDIPTDRGLSKVKTFGYLGSITHEKGVELLLADFTSSPLKEYSWGLKIAGTGEPFYLNKLKTQFANNLISFEGTVNADDFYKNIDALLVPSQWEEPFGRVVIEAAQKGLTVFVSNKGALKELENKISSVFLYSKENLQLFLNNELKVSKNNLPKEFFHSNVVKKYETLYFKHAGIKNTE